MKILIIRTGAIGDVIHSTIMPQAIKQTYPDSEIHFLTADYIACLLEDNPDIKKVIRFDMSKKSNLLYLFELRSQLRKEKYDIIFNLSNSIRNIFLSYAIGAKVIKRSKERVHAVDAFYNTACTVFEDLEKPENLKLYINKDIESKIQSEIEKYSRPYFVFCPCGEHDQIRPGRIWVDTYWIELGNKLTEIHGGTVFICGSKSEAAGHQKYTQINNSVLMSGKLTLDESAALFSQADLCIAGDSGPLHLASAVGVKTLGIMGSTRTKTCGPYGKNGYAIRETVQTQENCDIPQDGELYTPRMKALTPQKVFEFLNENKLI